MSAEVKPLPTGIALLITLALIGLMGYGGLKAYHYLNAQKPEARTFERAEKAAVVEIAPVLIEDNQPRISTFGQLQSSDRLELRSAVAGRVVEIAGRFADGAYFQAGELILRIDPFDYQSATARAQADLAEREARLAENTARAAQEQAAIASNEELRAIAERDYERLKALHAQGNVSDRGLDDGRNKLAQFEASAMRSKLQLNIYAAQRDQLLAAKKSLLLELERAERNLAKTELRAPFDAYVSEINAAEGRQLSTNDRVATLVRARALDVLFTLSDQQYGRLVSSPDPLIGRPIDVVWGEGSTSRAFRARIERVSSVINAQKGGVDIIARIDQLPENSSFLRSGSFVEVSLDDRLYRNTIRLPRTALYDQTRVYRMNAERRLEVIEARLAGFDNESVLITSDTLRAGDNIVTNRLSVAGEGLLVRLKDDPPPRRGRKNGKTRGGKPANNDGVSSTGTEARSEPKKIRKTAAKPAE